MRCIYLPQRLLFFFLITFSVFATYPNSKDHNREETQREEKQKFQFSTPASIKMPFLPIELWEIIFKTPTHCFYVDNCLPPRLANKSLNEIIRNAHVRFVMTFKKQDDFESYLRSRIEGISLRFSDLKFVLKFGFKFLEPKDPLAPLLGKLRHLKIEKQCLNHKTTNILAFLTHVETLKLDSCHIGPREIDEIITLFTLQKLDLRYNKINKAFNKLALLTNLTYLNIAANLTKKTETEKKYEDLIAFTFLQALNLSAHPISQQSASAFYQLTNLTSLDVSRCKLMPQVVPGFLTLTNLQSLDFSYNALCNESLQGYSHLTNLTALYARGCAVNGQHLKSIKNLTRLKILDLSRCRVSAEGLYLLTTLSHLQTLYFETKTLDDNTTQALVTLTSLTALSLDCPTISTLAVQNLHKLSNLTFLFLCFWCKYSGGCITPHSEECKTLKATIEARRLARQ